MTPEACLQLLRDSGMDDDTIAGRLVGPNTYALAGATFTEQREPDHEYQN